LKALDAGFNYLAGQHITVYTRFSTLKWLYTSKSLTGRIVQWATMLSPWEFTVVRCNDEATQLTALLTSSITPFKHFDEALEDIKPAKFRALTSRFYAIPHFNRNQEAYVATFDGAVRTKTPVYGAYAVILWKLPEWHIIHAENFYTP